MSMHESPPPTLHSGWGRSVLAGILAPYKPHISLVAFGHLGPFKGSESFNLRYDASGVIVVQCLL